MYTIYIDDNLVYAPDLAYKNYTLLSPKVVTEINKAGSVTFILPPTNPMYDYVRKLTSIITVYDGTEEIFRGRVLHDEKDFYKRKDVYCEGELSFFLDSILRPYEWSGSVSGLVKYYLDNHNAQVEEAKRFQLGNITVTDPNDYIVRSSTQYPCSWDEMNEKLLGLLGGYFFVRKRDGLRYFDYLETPENINAQTIEFGKNILDLSEYISGDDVFTVLIPLGAQDADDAQTRLTIASVNNGKDYIVNEDAVALFGYIWKTATWDDVTLASNLYTKGKAYLDANIELAVSLTLRAVDLHLMNVNTERIKVGDYVRVISAPHKIDQYFLCTKISLDLESPDNSEYTFGFSYSTMTERLASSTSAMQSASIVAAAAAEAAKQSASRADASANSAQQVVVQIASEYVKTDTFDNFKEEVNAKIASVYTVCGSVDTYGLLPKSGNRIGDVYNVLDTGANYVWTSYGWDKLSETIDLSGYATQTDLEELAARVSALENPQGDSEE